MYKVVIGLEVHCEVKTNSKNFSGSTNTYTNIPNINVSTVDLGLPGILPVANEEAVKKAIKTAMALNCKIPDEVVFDRKNYYYPDLPKGYQITQVTKPFGKDGYLTYFVGEKEKTVYIHQLHLEEDTASLEHCDIYSLIDYNRSGIPLMEIVTEPCIHSADEAVLFLESLRSVFTFCEVSEARSDKGQMRCDVNVSLMKDTDTEFGTKVEIKNINSFVSVRAAIEYEIKRQSELLDNGEKVIQETRRIDATDGKTYSMREKVDAVDYKYFIEPNIPPVKLEKEFLDSIKNELPELQYEKIKRYMNLGITLHDATILVKDKNLSLYFDEVYNLVELKETAKNWIISYLIGELNKLEISISDYNITASMFANVINLVNKKELNQLHAKEIFAQAYETKKDPIKIIEEKGIKKISGKEELMKYVLEAILESPNQVKEYLSGKEMLANYFLGQIMKKTNKQADPVVTLELIKEELSRRK